MRGSLAFVVLLGCATERAPPDSSACVQTVELVGSTDATATNVGPWSVDSNGIDICMHLDATPLVHGHFAAATQYTLGTVSGFDTVLLDADGTTLQTGWDVSVGTTNAMTFADLEWDMPGGTTRDTILHVSTPAIVAYPMLSLSLIEPLED